MTMSNVLYPITDRLQNDQIIIIRAHKETQYIELLIPFDGSDNDIVYTITGIRKKKDALYLEMHMHDEFGCGPDEDLHVSMEMVCSWTNLSEDEIRDAFTSISRYQTMNLLRRIPRKLVVRQQTIEIVLSNDQIRKKEDICERT